MFNLWKFVCCAILTFAFAHGDMNSWLDMMTRCEGSCYYFPEKGPGEINHDCKNFVFGERGRLDFQGAISLATEPCKYVMSLQEYIPNCDTFDRQPLTDRLCTYHKQKPDTNLYLITVARRFPIQGCNTQVSRNPPFDLEAYKDEFNKINNTTFVNGSCNVWDENVAFTLSPTRETNLKEEVASLDQLYYVCTNEGVAAYPYYVGIEPDEPDDPPAGYNRTSKFKAFERVTLSLPYADGAPGILWHRVRKPMGERTIICSVVMSLDTFQYRHSEWAVELVGGKPVMRHIIRHENLRPLSINLAASATQLWPKVADAHIRRYYHLEKNEPVTNFRVKEDGEMKDGRKFIKWITNVKIENVESSASSVNFLELEPANYKRSLYPPVDAQENASILKKIDAIYATCRDNKALCFNFPWQEGCQSREKCHMLVVIEQVLDFQRLHIDMLTHPHSLHPIVKPYSYGWMGFAFSQDARMGGESVFTCSFKGRTNACAEGSRPRVVGEGPECSKIYISINLEHAKLRGTGLEEKNNYYSGDEFDPEIGNYQQLIENPKVEFGEVPSESEPRVLCSFDIRTSDYTNISVFPKRPKEILRYDLLNREYYVLMATGRSVTGDWQLSYHGAGNRASGADMKFSREIYKEKIKIVPGQRSHTH